MVASSKVAGGQQAEGVEGYRKATEAWAERGRLVWLVGSGVTQALTEIGACHAGPGADQQLVAHLQRLIDGTSAGAAESEVGVSAPTETAARRGGQRERDRIWQGQERRLDDRRYLVLFFGSRAARGSLATLAVGVDDQGVKHVLGVWEYTPALAAAARLMVADLAGRGLSAAAGLLAVIPGNPGLDEAVRRTWGSGVLVAHCQSWVRHQVLGHLPERARPSVAARLQRAWSMPAAQAAQELSDVVAQLERDHPGAAARLKASQAATLVVAGLGLPERLRRHLQVAGPARGAIENALAAAAPGKRGLSAVKAGLPSVAGRLRRLIGYEALPQLAEKLRLHAAGTSR